MDKIQKLLSIGFILLQASLVQAGLLQAGPVQEEAPSSPLSEHSHIFSLSSQEMVFASKLSDANRRLFCYTFSSKERTLAMQGDPSLSPDERVEKIATTSH